jgi:hypothetical protein
MEFNKNSSLEHFGRSHVRRTNFPIENFKTLPNSRRLTPIANSLVTTPPRSNFIPKSTKFVPILPPIKKSPILTTPYRSSGTRPVMRPYVSANSSLRSPVVENFLPLHRGKRFSNLNDRPPFVSNVNAKKTYIKSPVRKPYVPNFTPRSPIARSPISRRSPVKESYRYFSRF